MHNNRTNNSKEFSSIADRLLLLPAVFMLVLVGMFVIMSLSVFWFDEELVLLPLFVIVGLVVVEYVEMTMMVSMGMVKVVIDLLLLVMVEEMVVLRPSYVPF